MSSAVHVFGIRHHGPGSARSLLAALAALAPDAILVEGPPDAQPVLELAAGDGMEPPLALLVYAADDPQRAVFYPFALFSPEWQAIRFGLGRTVPVRFIDLPQSHRMADAVPASDPAAETEGVDEPIAAAVRVDPLNFLAEIAGYRDGERWWDHVVESRHHGDLEVFQAVREAMAALREQQPADGRRELQREAFMRQQIRAAVKEGFERIAVVCGAWHAPALADLPPAAGDAALLKGLGKVKTRAAWVPWSYDRLAFRSGYGAGVESPEWYHLLWEQRDEPVTHWMTRMARLMRARDFDASSAHVIEAVRLAGTLATLRGRALPGLDELLEAAQAVVCTGASGPLRVIERALVYGHRLGKVPEDLPLAPLQEDLAREQKRLRLPASGDHKDYDLDLRKPNDLARSHLLYRLRLIGIRWGDVRRGEVRSTGTFHEHWRLQWNPEFAVALVDAARWGSTVAEAATAIAVDQAVKTEHVDALAALVGQVLLADLPLAVEHLLRVLEERAAVARDVLQLMDALPPLAQTRRYGSVRQTDGAVLDTILGGLTARICIGMGPALASLDDEAAAAMNQRLMAVDGAMALLDRPDDLAMWHRSLAALAGQSGLHPLVAGRVARLLHDARIAAVEDTTRRMYLALSPANGALPAAHWIEGFVSGSGTILLHDAALWGLMDGWLAQLSDPHFVEALPLLRRTFATFPAAERRQMGERARHGAADEAAGAEQGFNHERASRVLPVLRLIFGTEESA